MLCWVRLLRVPWTARKSNQSILKEIITGCSLVGLMLKLKLQCFGHLMQRTDSFEKTLMLGKIEGRGQGDDRGWDGWMASLTKWTWAWANSRSCWWTERLGVLQSMGLQSDMTEQLNWAQRLQGLVSHRGSRKRRQTRQVKMGKQIHAKSMTIAKSIRNLRDGICPVLCSRYGRFKWTSWSNHLQKHKWTWFCIICLCFHSKMNL